MKPGQHIPTLDGLRAISFLIVFASHAGLGHLIPGGFGVTVFFFLSGFLITTLMRQEQENTGTVSLKHFYLRRALRILPPFYLVLLLASVAFPKDLAWPAVLAQCLHVANYWTIAMGWPEGQAPGTGVYWSLAVEEHFYFLFPLLFLFVQRRGLSHPQKAAVLYALCAGILAWRIYLVAHGATAERTNIGSDTRFDSILFGCALALYGNPHLDPAPTRERLWKYALLPAGVLALLFSFAFRHDAFRETARYSLQGVALIPIFVAAIRWPTLWPFRPLNWRPVAFLGALSYSLYLVHDVILRGLASTTGLATPVRAVLGLALSIGLSWIIYVAVEKPAARMRRRLSATVDVDGGTRPPPSSRL